jgi:general secretion pathway protein A
MYEEYFGLTGAPFKLSPDPKFFFGSRSHNKAMAYLHYGLRQAEGFIVITGPVGAGKSMVIGHLLNQLDRSNIVAAQLLTSNVEPDELLDHILSSFRIEPEGEGRTGQLEAFEDYLFDQLNRGKRVLLIMDEAQNLPLKTLEELRMLSNIDFDGTPLFQVFLIGQPEFRETLAGANMEQLKQRVIASYHLENLTYEETKEYILHRLSVVGWREDPAFSDGAFKAIFAETGGRPRRINTLCNRLMLYCSLEQIHDVTRAVVKEVAAELHEEKLGSDEAQGNNKKAAAPKARSAKQRQTKQTKIKDVEAPAVDVPVPSSASVFDRLRAQRSVESEMEPSDDRQEATLSDVATAIAEASGRDAQSNGDEDHPHAELDDETAPVDTAGAEPAPAGNSSAWRKNVMRPIDETREDLKYAHARVQQLRGKISEMEQHQGDKRSKIADSLSRAQTLLGEIRRAR